MNMESLIKEVVIPFDKSIQEDKEIAKYFASKEISSKYNFDIAKLSIALLYDATKAREIMIQLADTYKDLGIDTQTMHRYMMIFFKLHKKWAKENFNTDNYYDLLMDKFDDMFVKIYDEKLQNSFFTIDSEENDEYDELINHVLQTHHQKTISAKEYLDQGDLTQDDLADIIETIDKCEELLNYQTLEPQFLEKFIGMMQMLSYILYNTQEFKDVGYAMEHFAQDLEAINLETLPPQKKEFVWNMLIQLSKDLEKWIKYIFVDKSVDDIHYFDASFLASMAQFNILINKD
ncbi:MAG: hypothetical protein GXO40_03865 [Epsilonproteobacteria bacterium]|nr:hypothetical protein [Campylobacterota bacterium]